MFKRLLTILTLIFGVCFLSIIVSEVLVECYAAKRVYNDTKEIPSNKVGLLLGTSKKLQNGNRNLYYKYRIDAAVRLFKKGKIQFILVSGDNGNIYYNEPTTIKNDLTSRGIPASRIFLDYAGFRTYDSVVRCKKVFQQEKFTVISQQFHNERAIFIAKIKGLDAIGYNAKDVGVKFGMKTKIRERFARVKMMIDLLIGKEPKFLGEKINIE